MGRPCKFIADINAQFGMRPLRQYWQEINRHERQKAAENRAERKARDRKRSKCRCDAYKFPHRPGGGLCRHPDPPAVRWQDREAKETAWRVAEFKRRWGEPSAEQLADLTAMTSKEYRPYRKRYAGIVRQICRNNGLNPIRDRKVIAKLMPLIIGMAKQLKHQAPQAKFRNMRIIDRGDGNYTLQGVWTTAGPTM
jgi:hypothetical protein